MFRENIFFSLLTKGLRGRDLAREP